MQEWKLRHLQKLLEFGEKVFLNDAPFYTLIQIDDNIANMLGYSRPELFIYSRSRLSELIYPPDLEEYRKTVSMQILEQKEYTCRYRMRRKDGKMIWVWESGMLTKDAKGREMIQAMVANISHEESIRKERDAMYDNVPGGVMTLLITKSNFYVTDANRQSFDMVGVPREEYLGSSGMLTFQEDLPKVRTHIVAQGKRREPIDIEFRLRSGADQKVRWSRLLGRYYKDVEDGCEYLCMLIDVTERKINTFYLERQLERYRLSLGVIEGVLFEYRPDTAKLEVFEDSSRGNTIVMFPEQASGTWDDIFVKSRLVYKGDVDKLKHFEQSELPFAEEMRLLTKNRQTGEVMYQWYQFVAVKVREGGRVVRIAGNIKSITEQSEADEEQKELQRIIKLQSAKIYELIMKVDVVTGKIWGNSMGTNPIKKLYAGDGFEKFVQMTSEKYVHPDDRARFINALQLEHMQEILNFSDVEEIMYFRVLSKDGEYRHKCFRYSYDGNHMDAIIITTQDMHVLREEQLKMMEADRKILLGALNEAKESVEVRRTFSTLLVRELKFPMEFISSVLRRQERNLEEGKPLRDAISYMSHVLQNIQEFEQLEQETIVFENRKFALGKTIKDIVASWERKKTVTGVTVCCDLNLDHDYCYGDAVRVQQIVGHVLGNCIKSSVSGKEVHIWGSQKLYDMGVGKLILIFEDSGIPVTENFFGRAYTLKMSSEEQVWWRENEQMGTMFSLLIARQLAEKMGGSLHAVRKNERVNELRLELPLPFAEEVSETVPASLQRNTPIPKVDLQGASLLLVENPTPFGSELTGPILRLNGARLDIAASGEEGIALWNSYPQEVFDAVLVDASLPDMDYLEFVENFRSQDRPDAKRIPILVMLDALRQEDVREGMHAGVTATLNKPLELRRLKIMLEILQSE